MTRSAFVMRRLDVAMVGGRMVVALDTIAHAGPEDRDQVIVTGSHGGSSSGEYAGRAGPAAVFFNDAGIGKDEAGVAALTYLDDQGVMAGTVAHDSALIGDAVETWECGQISALNRRAEARGFESGEPLRAAVIRVFGALA